MAYADESALVPVDEALAPVLGTGHAAVQLTWPAAAKADGGAFFYTVFRSPSDGSGGVDCDDPACVLTMQRLANAGAASTTYLDFNPAVPAGTWTYRLGISANWHADENDGGLLA